MNNTWSDNKAYEYTRKLDASQWAWEFLRRNAEYKNDWKWFNEIWQMLEAEYGSPPNRDMALWKKDKRAWRSEAELHGCDETGCEKRGDDLLIECWMGSKWGFYKYPLDPAVDAMAAKDNLIWREVETSVQLVDKEDAADIENDLNMALLFDLTLPLKGQLGEAKRFLVASQRTLKKSGRLDAYSIKGGHGRWIKGLQLLDGRAAGAGDAEIAQTLFNGDEFSMAELAMEAEGYVAGGYLQILLMPKG